MSSLFDIHTVHGFSNVAFIFFTIFIIPLFFKLSLRQIVISEIAIISSLILYFGIIIKTSEMLDGSSIFLLFFILLSIAFIFFLILSYKIEEGPFYVISYPVASLVLLVLFSLSFCSTVLNCKNKTWLHNMQAKIAQIEAGHVSYKILDNIPQSQYNDNTLVDITEVMKNGKLREDTIIASKITSVIPFKVIGKENLNKIKRRLEGTDVQLIRNEENNIYFLCHISTNNSHNSILFNEGVEKMDVVMSIHDYTLVVRNILDFNRRNHTTYNKNKQIEKMIAEEKD